MRTEHFLKTDIYALFIPSVIVYMLVIESSMQCLQDLCCEKCCTVNVMCIVCILGRPAFRYHGFVWMFFALIFLIMTLY